MVADGVVLHDVGADDCPLDVRKQPQYIAAALYGGVCGAPAIFPRSTFRELAQLRGDTGARALLRSQSDRIVRVPMPGAALDVDTPEDLLAVEAPARDG